MDELDRNKVADSLDLISRGIRDGEYILDSMQANADIEETFPIDDFRRWQYNGRKSLKITYWDKSFIR